MADATRAVYDGARECVSLRDVRGLVIGAVAKGVTTKDLTTLLDEGAVGGTAWTRRAVLDAERGCASPPEAEAVDAMIGCGWPFYVNPDLYLAGSFLCQPDVFLVGTGSGGELDSVEHHNATQAKLAHTLNRHTAAAKAVDLLHRTPWQLRQGPAAWVRDLIIQAADRLDGDSATRPGWRSALAGRSCVDPRRVGGRLRHSEVRQLSVDQRKRSRSARASAEARAGDSGTASSSSSTTAATPSTVSAASAGTLRLSRASPIVEQDVCTDSGQRHVGAVEVQANEPARRPAEVPDAGDALLTPVAALVEVDRGAEPADFVRERAVVGVEAEPRAAVGDAQRLEGHHAGGALDGRHQGVALTGRPLDHELGHRRDLDPEHEAHRVEVAEESGAGAGFDVHEHLGARLGQVQVVLDVALRGQHEGLGGRARHEPGHVLRHQRVQPRQPVRTGDPQHVAVRQVHDATPGGERPLLGVGVAVVTGDGLVGRVCEYGCHTCIKAQPAQGIPANGA
jgi:hypothetical protein